MKVQLCLKHSHSVELCTSFPAGKDLHRMERRHLQFRLRSAFIPCRCISSCCSFFYIFQCRILSWSQLFGLNMCSLNFTFFPLCTCSRPIQCRFFQKEEEKKRLSLLIWISFWQQGSTALHDWLYCCPLTLPQTCIWFVTGIQSLTQTLQRISE